MQQIAIFGTSGAIGSAFVRSLVNSHPTARIHAFSRQPDSVLPPNVSWTPFDLEDEKTLATASDKIEGPLDLVLVTSGFLHGEHLQPEKALKDLSAEKFHKNFALNTIGPALIAKYFIPKLNRERKSVFAALSARVGSINDNRLGGWYAYRASKAALNMVLKTASIEAARRNKQAVIIGLHPGTVDSLLSRPFQSNVPDKKLFIPDQAVSHLMKVIDAVVPEDSGKIFAWDGQPIPY